MLCPTEGQPWQPCMNILHVMTETVSQCNYSNCPPATVIMSQSITPGLANIEQLLGSHVPQAGN